jgi:hypothetical protein
MAIGDVNFNALFPLIIFLVSICSLILFKSLVRTNFELNRKVGVVSTIAVSYLALVSQILRWLKFDNGALKDVDIFTLNGMVNADRVAQFQLLFFLLFL